MISADHTTCTTRLRRALVIAVVAVTAALPARGAGSAPTVVSRVGYINGTPLTSHVTAAFATTGASTLVAFVSTYAAWNGQPVAISGVTDSTGNTWSILTGPTNFAGASSTLLSTIFYVHAPATSVAHTVTVHLTNPAPLVAHVFAAARTNIAEIPLYTPIGDPGAGSSSAIVTSAALTVPANTLLLGWTKNESSAAATAPSPWTLDPGSTSFLWAESREGVSAGSYAASFQYDASIGWQGALVGLPPSTGPVAYAQSVQTTANTPVDVTLAATSTEGVPLTFSIVDAPLHGQLSGTPPNVTYAPATDYVGADTFTFKANDGTADSNVASVDVTVRGPNHAPVASAASVSAASGTATSVTLVASDPDNDPLAYIIVVPPAHGVLGGAGAARTYTPAADYVGSDSFTFKVNDGFFDSNIAAVTISVQAAPPRPTLVGRSGYINGTPLASHTTVSFDTTGASTLVAFVSTHPSWNGQPVSLVSMSDNTGNAWTMLTGPALFAGASARLMSAIYYVNAPSTSPSHTVTVTLTNPAPLVVSVFAVSNTDVASPPLYTPITDPGPALGSTAVTSLALTVPDNALLLGWAKNESPATATAPSPWTLDSSSTSFLWAESQPNVTGGRYSADFSYDTSIGWQAAMVALTAPGSPPVNNPPIASGQSVSTSMNTPIGVTLSALDPDSDALTYSIVTTPANGTISGAPPAVTYTPAPDFSGSDTFTFKANDGQGDSNIATVDVSIQSRSLPSIVARRGYINGTALATHTTAAFNSTGAATLVAFVSSHPSWNGVPVSLTDITDSEGNTWTRLTGPADFAGATETLESSIFYVIGAATSTAHTVTVSLTNPAPLVVHIVAVASSDVTRPPLYTPVTDPGAGGTNVSVASASLNVPEGALLVGWVKNESSATAGAPIPWTIDPESSSFLWAETWADASAGAQQAQFVYDQAIGWQTALVVFPPVGSALVNNAPIATASAVVVSPNTARTLALTASDPDSDPLIFSLVSPPVHGTLSGTPPTLTYTPAAGYLGTDSFSFKATDGQADSNVATVTLTVAVQPLAIISSRGYANSTPLLTHTTGAFNSVGASTLVAFVSTHPPSGVTSLTDNLGNTWHLLEGPTTYAGTGAFELLSSIYYVNAPATGLNHTVTVGLQFAAPLVVHILAVSGSDISAPPLHAPISNPDARSSDVVSRPLTVPATTLMVAWTKNEEPADATALDGWTLDQESTEFLWAERRVAAAEAAYSGHFSYSVPIGWQTAIVGIPPAGSPRANNRPIATDISLALNPDGSVDLALTATDPDSDPLTYQIVSGPTKGTLTGTAPNVTYTANPGFVGTDTFTFKVNDGKVDSNIATVTLTVAPITLTLTGFTPGHGRPGDMVSIFGTGLTAATGVRFDTTSQPLFTTGSWFAARTILSTSPGPANVVSGDLDGDGRLDVAAVNYGFYGDIGQTISVWRNTSADVDLTFAPAMSLPTGSGPHDIRLGDLDGDGRPDLVTSNYGAYAGGTTVSILRNESVAGTPAFAPHVEAAVGSGPVGLGLSDLDGDGRLDVVVTNFDDGHGSSVTVLRNISSVGAIAFAPPVSFVTGNGPYGVAVKDLDGDGRPEIVTGNYGLVLAGDGSTISILRNTSVAGSIGFAPNVDVFTGTGPRSVAISDVDGDGVNDVIVGNFGEGTVSVLRNESTGGSLSFAQPVKKTVGSSPMHVAVADLDGDARPEIVTANFGSSSVSVVQNASTVGAVALGSRTDIPTGTGPHGLTLGDLDSDGWVDILDSDYGSIQGSGRTVSIVRNLSPAGTEIITTVPPGATTGPIQVVVPGAIVTSANPFVVLNPNSAPVAASQSVTTAQDTGLDVALTATDADADPLTYVIVASPVHGALTGTPPALTYTPALGFVGTDTVTFKANDGSADSNVATVAITVTAQSLLIAQVTPSIGAPGDIVRLTGAGLTAATVVRFNGTPQTIFDVHRWFGGSKAFTTNTGPLNVDSGDIDGDGRPDLVVAIYGSTGAIGSEISILRNTSAGGDISFAARVDLATNSGPFDVRVADLDGDGKLDVVTTQYGGFATGNTIGVLRNQSTPGLVSFAPRVDIETGPGPLGLAIGDVDGDGLRDIVIGQFHDGAGTTVTVLRNTSTVGTVSFATPVTLGTGTGPFGVTLADFDGDGRPEIVTANYGSWVTGGGTTVSILRNLSTPGVVSFAARLDVTAGQGPQNVSVADFDGDGRTDLVVANAISSTISVVPNVSTIGSLAFATKIDFEAGAGPMRLGVGDLDGDGSPDVVVTNYSGGAGTSVSVWQNASTPGSVVFSPRTDESVALGPAGLVLVDLDGDHWSDIISTNYASGVGGSNTISILRNLAPAGSEIDVAVPAGATTGPIEVVTPIATAIGSTPFTVIGANQAPIAAGQNVTTGQDMPVSIVLSAVDPEGAALTYQIVAPPQHGTLLAVPPTLTYQPAGGYSGADEFTFVANDGVLTSNVATVSIGVTPSTPSLLAIDPTAGPVGSAVRIVGAGLTSATMVFFNSVAQSNFVTERWFGNATAPTVGVGPAGVAAGDLDGDGLPDLAVANYGSVSAVGTSLSLLRNTSTVGDLRFAAKLDLASQPGPWAVVLADLDGDGKSDIVSSNYGAYSAGTTFSVWRNHSAPGLLGFDARLDVATAAGPLNIVVADVDGDGRQDVLVTEYADGRGATVAVYRNLSAPGLMTFDSPVTLSAGPGPFDLVVADLDGDGRPDLAVGNHGSWSAADGNTIAVFRNTSTSGAIAFASKLDLAAGAGPAGIAAADLDGDGRRDIIVAGTVGATISVLLNNSSPGGLMFAGKVDIAVGGNPMRVAVGDLDGDGRRDVVVTNFGENGAGNTVSVLLNTSAVGSVALTPRADVPVGSAPLGLALSDFDGDGWLDLASSGYGVAADGTTVSIMRNLTPAGTQLTTVVPTGATSGPVQIVTPTIVLTGSFTVQP